MSLPATSGNIYARPAESILGIGYTLLVNGEQTGGEFELMLFVAAPGIGPPPHVHTNEDELFYVVEGEFDVLRGEETLHLKAGEYVYLPRGTVHGFKTVGDSTGRFLCWVTPGHLEGFFDCFKRDWPAEQEQPSPPSEQDIGKMMAAAEQYQIEMKL